MCGARGRRTPTICGSTVQGSLLNAGSRASRGPRFVDTRPGHGRQGGGLPPSSLARVAPRPGRFLPRVSPAPFQSSLTGFEPPIRIARISHKTNIKGADGSLSGPSAGHSCFPNRSRPLAVH